jgi:hypothetical protein
VEEGTGSSPRSLAGLGAAFAWSSRVLGSTVSDGGLDSRSTSGCAVCGENCKSDGVTSQRFRSGLAFGRLTSRSLAALFLSHSSRSRRAFTSYSGGGLVGGRYGDAGGLGVGECMRWSRLEESCVSLGMLVEETSVAGGSVLKERGYLALLASGSKVIAYQRSMSPTSWIWKELILAFPGLFACFATDWDSQILSEEGMMDYRSGWTEKTRIREDLPKQKDGYRS